MICAGCNREIVVGERYIVDTASGFTGLQAEEGIDAIVGEIFGSSDGRVRFCEDCTEPGGTYVFETNYGEEA